MFPVQTEGNDTPRPPNPFYRRLMRAAKPPTIKQTVALTAILLLVSTVLVKLNNDTIYLLLLIIEFLANLLVAPVMAGMAALITSDDAQTESFVLQKITLLRTEAVVWAYNRVAWFRARLVVALVIGLLPVLAESTRITQRPLECHIFIPRSEIIITLSQERPRICAQEGDLHFVLVPLTQLVALNVFVLAAIPAGLFGVWLGLALRRFTLATGIVVLVTMLANGIGWLMLMLIVQRSYSMAIFHPWPDPLYWIVWAVGVLLLLSLGFYWMAQRAI